VNFGGLGRGLLVAGVVLVVLGALFVLLDKAGVTRLPGDLVWRGERATIYIPLGLSILASIVLTVVLNFLLRR
jgi:hypothetical protein